MSVRGDAELAAEFSRAAEELAADLQRRNLAAGDPDPDGTERRGFAAAVEAGWCEVLLPEGLGGLGLGFAELGGIFSVVGRHLFAGPLLEHAVAFPLLAAALPQRGEELAERLAPARPAALVDAAAVGGEAPLLDAEGRLSGTVECVAFAAGAERLVVFARDAGGREAVALVEPEAAGVEVTPLNSLDPATTLARVGFDPAAGAPAELLAAPGEIELEPIRDAMRLMLAGEQVGLAAHTLERAVAYAGEREQFGRPIGSFQAVQQILAEMSRRTLVLERVCRRALDCPAEGESLRIAAWVAKVAVALHARGVVEDSLQVHGGVGFTIELDLHRYYKRVLSLQDLYGGVELAARLGSDLLAAGADPWPAMG